MIYVLFLACLQLKVPCYGSDFLDSHDNLQNYYHLQKISKRKGCCLLKKKNEQAF